MESLNQGRKLYIKCYNYETSLLEEDKTQLKQDIQRFITIALKEAPLKQLFANKFILTALQEALERCSETNGDVGPVTRAFESAEKYILLLVEQPWKPEYKRLKLYGGFYKTRMSSVLPRAEEIFFAAGYKISTDNQLLVHKGHVEKDRLLPLAFDCRIATVQSRNVAESYRKLKNIGQSYSDVISKTFQDVSVRDKAVPTNSSVGRKSASLPTKNQEASSFNTSCPPAIPKREPLVNGRPPAPGQVSYDLAYAIAPQVQALRSLPQQKPPPLSQGAFAPFQQSLGHGQSNLWFEGSSSQEAIPYMDTAYDEIIPELPEGTCDEHQRESLKHLQTDVPKHVPPIMHDNWDWFRDLKDKGGIIDPRLANPGTYMYPSVAPSAKLSVQTYPPGFDRSKVTGIIPGPSLDEGIQEDLLPSSGFLIHQQQVILPNKSLTRSLATDSGYGTIYHPSTSLAHSRANFRVAPMSTPTQRMNGSGTDLQIGRRSASIPGPPPVPSRALKPTTLSRQTMKPSEDFVDGEVPPTYAESELICAPQMINWVNLTPKPQLSTTEPILRRDRQLGKSSSLKQAEDTSVAKIKAQTRAVRSMDLTLSQWTCQACSTTNMASDMVCSVCAHSRGGTPKDFAPVCGETRKPCPKCTFENDPSKLLCELCGSKLEDRFTYV